LGFNHKGIKEKVIHSGYATSMPDGVYQKQMEWLTTPSLPTAPGSALYSLPLAATGLEAGLCFSASSDSDVDSVADADSMAVAMAVAIAKAAHKPAPLSEAVANQHTALGAAMAYDTDSLSAHTGAPQPVLVLLTFT
jgi:hypothetical protein